MVDDWMPRLFCFAFGIAVGFLLTPSTQRPRE